MATRAVNEVTKTHTRLGGKMMSETVNQVETLEEVKTFTQEELNKVVNDRLARERKKYEGIDLEELKRKAAELDKLEEANKTELDKANEKASALQAELDSIKKSNEIRAMREKVSSETGVPVNLINGSTEEECTAQANAIKEYAVPSNYPTVKDGGEIHNATKTTTRQQFAEWANNIF